MITLNKPIVDIDRVYYMVYKGKFYNPESYQYTGSFGAVPKLYKRLNHLTCAINNIGVRHGIPPKDLEIGVLLCIDNGITYTGDSFVK